MILNNFFTLRFNSNPKPNIYVFFLQENLLTLTTESLLSMNSMMINCLFKVDILWKIKSCKNHSQGKTLFKILKELSINIHEIIFSEKRKKYEVYFTLYVWRYVSQKKIIFIDTHCAWIFCRIRHFKKKLHLPNYNFFSQWSVHTVTKICFSTSCCFNNLSSV